MDGIDGIDGIDGMDVHALQRENFALSLYTNDWTQIGDCA